MATASDIQKVRLNTNENEDGSLWTDPVINSMIDELGVTGASAQIWRQKAATFAEEVDVTEAGASHKFSDLFKNAEAMAKHWDGLVLVEETAGSGRVRVKVINRQ